MEDYAYEILRDRKDALESELSWYDSQMDKPYGQANGYAEKAQSHRAKIEALENALYKITG